MLKFSEYINEKIISFGGKVYPKFGQIVILAGGAGSGKGFVLQNLLGIEGKVLDVDALKALALESPTIQKKAKDIGVDLTQHTDFKDANNVALVHTVLSDRLGVVNKHKETLLKSVHNADNDRLPNLIFDVTMKDIKKLHEITNYGKMLNYKPIDIHLVWIVNDFEVAYSQNLKRSRVVPKDIFDMTHVGAADTMLDIVKRSNELKSLIDGDIIFAFNKAKVDSVIQATQTDNTGKFSFSDKNPENIKTNINVNKVKGGQYIEAADFFYIKKAGKNIMSIDDIGIEILKKISDYTPSPESWDDILDKMNKK